LLDDTVPVGCLDYICAERLTPQLVPMAVFRLSAALKVRQFALIGGGGA